MRDWIRRWLGLYDITLDLCDIKVRLYNIEQNLDEYLLEVRAFNSAAGRIIAKLDPNYAKDPHSKETMKESDAVGDAVIKRLKGEIEARRKMEGKVE